MASQPEEDATKTPSTELPTVVATATMLDDPTVPNASASNADIEVNEKGEQVEENEEVVQVPEDPHPNHVKDYQTGISFSVHDSPLVEKKKRDKKSWVNVTKIPSRYRLVAEEDALKWSMVALRFCVLATACAQTVLQPNFPFLVIPGYSEYSFSDTKPFDFSAATYFLPMTTLFGTAITSAFVGTLSDKYGRVPLINMQMGLVVVTLIGQWFAQESFWGFCAASLANGLFCSALPVAMAYASDVHPSRAKKDEEIGSLVGANMLGMSGGGVVAILMDDSNLFAPLLVAAGVCLLSFVLCFLFLIEPDPTIRYEEDTEEGDDEGPEKIDWKLFSNVMVGALLDNIGSSGLFPLTLAPLAFNNFLRDANPPIMSEDAYKWLSVCVALMVIPGAALTGPIFAKIGAAGGCVMGNAITAVGIVLCMLVAEIKPPTTGTFAAFIVCLYSIFPLTVISQLSTGPMLDMLAPVDKRGFAQGVNMTIMNFAFAVSPWMLGIMSDNIGVIETLWFCFGVSILASLVNAPLMFAQALKRREPMDYQQAMGLEDQDLVERALDGQWVPAKFIDDLNYSRFQKGLPMLRIPIKPYEEDKPNLRLLKVHAKEDFTYHRFIMHDILADIETPEGRKKSIETLNKVIPSKEDRHMDAQDMGKWFADYMEDNGYFLDGGWPPVYKQMIMQSFPAINTGGEITEDNVEQTMVRTLANMNRFLREEGASRANRAFRNSVIV